MRPSKSEKRTSATVVKLNYFINEISDVDANSQCFTVDFYLDIMWSDQRLKHLCPDDAPFVDWSSVWNPALEIANARSAKKLFETHLIDGNGKIKVQSRIRAVCSTEMNLRQFPFDAQTLSIVMESAEHEADEVELVPFEDAGCGLSEHVKQMRERSEWSAEDTTATSKHHTLEFDGSCYSRFIADIVIIRQVGFYAKKVNLIIMLITAMNWSVYFLHPTDDVADRIGISSTLALTAVAFQFAISDSLPKVPYLTRMDKYMNYCFLNIALSVPLSIITYRIDLSATISPDTVQAVDWAFLGISVTLFLLCTLVSFCRGYGKRQRADRNKDGHLSPRRFEGGTARLANESSYNNI